MLLFVPYIPSTRGQCWELSGSNSHGGRGAIGGGGSVTPSRGGGPVSKGVQGDPRPPEKKKNPNFGGSKPCYLMGETGNVDNKS